MGGNTSHSDTSKLMKTTKILFLHQKKHEVEVNTKHQVVLVMREMFLKGFICRHFGPASLWFGVYDYNCRKQLMSSCAFPWCWR